MPAGLPATPTAPAATVATARGDAAPATAAAHAMQDDATAMHDAAPADLRGDAFALLLEAPVASHVPMAAAPAIEAARDTTEAAPGGEASTTSLPTQLLAMLGLAAAPSAQPQGNTSAAMPAAVAPTRVPTTTQLQPQPGAQAAGPSHAAAPTLPTPLAITPLAATAASAPPPADPAAFAALAAAIAPSASETAPVPEPAARGTDAIAALASAAPAAAPDTARAPPPPSLPATLAQPADPGAGYGDEFGANLVWMADRRLGHAEIRLNPEHLGPVEVRVQLDGDRVHAEFHSAQAEVRQALEASLPRLRELLGQHGLQLAQADVGQRRGEGQQPQAHSGADGRDADDAPLAQSQANARRVRGLLDEYA